MVRYMRCRRAVCETVIIDKTLIILIGRDISIEIVIFGTFEGILDFALGSLKDYFLHLLDISSFLTLVGFLALCAPSLPPASGIETFSGLVLLVHLLKATCSLFMPKLITIGAFLLEACAIIREVARLPA